MKYTCKICGKEYDYCHSCSIIKDTFKNAGYCGENCYEVSMLIQQYRSNALEPKDAMELLEMCGADKMTLVPGVAKYYDEIKKKIAPKAQPIVAEHKEEGKSFSSNKRNKNKEKIEESLRIEENTSSLITDKDTELLSE